MGSLSNEQFLVEAAKLFESSTKSRSSLYITQKRLIEHDEVEGNDRINNELSKFNDTKPILPTSKAVEMSETQHPILIRITNGSSDKTKKIKISTTVKPEVLSKFWFKYSNVLKSGVSGLKKKSKKKKKVTK